MFCNRFIVYLTVLSLHQVIISIWVHHPQTSSADQIKYMLNVIDALAKHKISSCFWEESNNHELGITIDVINNLTGTGAAGIDQNEFNLFILNTRSIDDQTVESLETYADTEIPMFGCLRKLDKHIVMEKQISKLKTAVIRPISVEMLMKQLCTTEKRFERALNEIEWDSDVLNSVKVKTLILFINASRNNDNPIRLLTDHLRPIITASFKYAVSLTSSKRIEYIQSIMTCLWNHRNSEWTLDEFQNPVSVIGEFMVDLINTNRASNTLSDDCIRIKNLVHRYEPSASDYELNTICDFAHRFEKNFYRTFRANEIGLASSHELIDDVVLLDTQSCRFSMKNIRERFSFYFNKYLVSNRIPIGFDRNKLELLISVEDRFITYLSEFNDPENIANYVSEVRRSLTRSHQTEQSEVLAVRDDYPVSVKLESMQIKCILDKYKTAIISAFDS